MKLFSTLTFAAAFLGVALASTETAATKKGTWDDRRGSARTLCPQKSCWRSTNPHAGVQSCARISETAAHDRSIYPIAPTD